MATGRTLIPASRRLLLSGLMAVAAGVGLSLVPKPTPTPARRRVAVRVSERFMGEDDRERIARWAKARGLDLDVGSETAAVPPGWESLHLSGLPVSEAVLARAARFPLTLEEGGFRFDGRAYREGRDAILLRDPTAPRETVVIGNSAGSVFGLAARRLFHEDEAASDYAVVSGELSKTGRFVAREGRLEIDRGADRDRIAEREGFLGELRRETRGVVEWQFRDSERHGLVRWEPVATRYAGKRGFSIRLFPDATTKALYTASSRPADLSMEAGRVRVDVDASAPPEPDLVSPVLAAAGLASLRPSLLDRETLLLAAGARRVGRWWGREIRGFGAFARAAGVEPSIEEVIQSSEECSPVLAVGVAASWLDAGARLEGESAAERSLADGAAALASKLSRWRDAAVRQPLAPPRRRPLPTGFLRGVSYAMTNSIEEGYVSARSRDTLERLATAAVNSVSIMPFGFSADSKTSRILFVHRRPSGETDEGTVRAAADARSLGMTAMVKPQLWVGGGGFVGDIGMPDDRSWREWFSSYRRFLVHHAVVAEAAGAALFCVGTELKSTEPREKDWRDVIAAVRLATGAPLLYAANWAVNAPRVPFWDALDAVGVDFYDPLGRTEKLTDAALEQGAREAVRPLAEISRKLGEKPVIFAEAGFPAVRAAWIAPHDEDSGRPPLPEDAARAIAALYRALSRESWWKGVYWWKAFSDGRPAPRGDRGFNFLGTPAEKAIAEGFRRLADPAPR